MTRKPFPRQCIFESFTGKIENEKKGGREEVESIVQQLHYYTDLEQELKGEKEDHKSTFMDAFTVRIAGLLLKDKPKLDMVVYVLKSWSQSFDHSLYEPRTVPKRRKKKSRSFIQQGVGRKFIMKSKTASPWRRSSRKKSLNWYEKVFHV